jgi:hypothetical protein
LKRPKNQVPKLISYARGIVAAMTGSPHFPSPDPPLATVEAAIDALASAEAATLTGLHESFPARDEKRQWLWLLLDQLRGYVQRIADADVDTAASKIESAGMFVKKAASLAPKVFGAAEGRVSGSVVLSAPRAKLRDAAYEWQMSLDGGKTWVSLPVTTRATTTVTGIAPGSKASFRYRTATKEGVGNWADLVTIVVR